jgi:hypothetical protein
MRSCRATCARSSDRTAALRDLVTERDGAIIAKYSYRFGS